MKTATNTAPSIAYTIIETLESPTTKIAIDSDGNKFQVPLIANIGDVLVFPVASESPVYMRIDDFTVGRTLQ